MKLQITITAKKSKWTNLEYKVSYESELFILPSFHWFEVGVLILKFYYIMNTHESYCSLTTARLLKQAGFDWEVYRCYETLPEKKKIFGGHLVPYQGKEREVLPAPTLAVAQRWLREVKNIDILISICVHAFEDVNEKAYIYTCIDDNTKEAKEYFEDAYYHTYEKAQEAGIKKALEIVLEKGE